MSDTSQSLGYAIVKVAQAEARVRVQRDLIESLKWRDLPLERAEGLLEMYEKSLVESQNHLALIQAHEGK